jgi:fatty-acyl-CoA synthase
LGVDTLDLDAGYEDELAAVDPTPVVREGVEEDTAWISYTSGTTGKPKGVVLSRRALRHVGLNLLLELDDVHPGERLILSQPLSHGAGYFVLPYLISGGGLFVQQKFDAEEIAALSQRPEVRTAKIVPAMLPDLLALPQPPRLDTLIYGGAPIGLPLLEASLDRFGSVLVQIYGQSEAPMTIACLHREDHLGAGAERLSVGRPWRSVALRAVGPDGEGVEAGETGEILISGDHLMTGYLGMAEATGEVMRDGWLATRDMGYLDERGFVYLMGRRDEMIISGGFNIAPREVEQVLLEHDAVVECVVFGVDDDRWGSAVHAAIVCEAPVSGSGLIDEVKPRLGFRTPKRIVRLDSIPKNAYGKLDREKFLSKIDGSAGLQ